MFKRSKLKYILPILVAFLMLGIIFISAFEVAGNRALSTSYFQYEIVGSFSAKNGFSDEDSHQNFRERYPELLFFDSRTNNLKDTGTLISPVFQAPTILSLFVAGYPKRSGNKLFIKQLNKDRFFTLNISSNPGQKWDERSWILPANFRGQPIQFFAIDNSSGEKNWLGVSSPFSKSYAKLIVSQLLTLAIIPIYSAHFFLFLLPGLLLGSVLLKRYKLNSEFTLILSIAISASIGYLTFWSYWLNQYFGLAISIFVMFSSLWIGGSLYQRNKSKIIETIQSKDIWIPVSTMFLVGLFYLSLLYISIPGQTEQVSIAEWRFFDSRPADNAIPVQFANILYNGLDPRTFVHDWLSSDRPPLQTGILLIQRPIMALTELSYQLLGAIIQCSWVAALWALCRTVKLSGRSLAMVMSFTIFSGFFLFNSVYIWPKMLAGSLIIFAFSLLLGALLAGRSPYNFELFLAVLVTALGLLSHGGVVFTLPATFGLLMLPGMFPGYRRLIIMGAIFYCCLAPWTAYQKLYDPPGNRLMKMHLAGVHSVDDRSSLQAIFDAYRSIRPSDAIANKWENVKTVVGQAPLLSSSFSEGDSKLTLWRVGEREHVPKALGILNIGWLVAFAKILWRDRRLKLNKKAVVVILGAALIDLTVWSLVLFGPGQTTLTHSSYATMMLLFTGLSILVSELPRWLSSGFLLIQIISFITVWIVTTPPVSANTLPAVPNLFMIALAICLAVLIFKVLFQLSKQRSLIFNS